MGAFAGPTESWIDLSPQNSLNGLVTDGLVLALDAGRTLSYPGSGTTWTDLSGLGNNGTLVNGVGYNSGNGGSLSFDGVNDYVSLPYTSLLNLGTEFTISAFSKNINASSVGSIFASYDVTTSNTYTEGFRFYKNINSSYGITANSMRLQYGRNSWAWNVYASNGLEIDDNDWHYVSVTASNLNTTTPNIIFYVDNSSITGTKWTASSTQPIRYASNVNSIRIGSTYTATRPSYSELYSNITTAQVSIYNRALTASEIQQNFNATRSRFGI